MWLVLVCLVPPGAVLLARHNLRRGRADGRGAARLAVYLFVVYLLAWLAGADHTALFTPITYDFAAWYARSGAVALAVLGALAAYGFVIAKGDRPLFRPGLLGDE